MIRRAFFVLLVFAVAGAGVSAAPSLFDARAIAQSTATPVAFSCNFAGFNQFNNLINTGIGCGTPGPGANYPTLHCSGAATCAPNSGPTPAIFVAVIPTQFPLATSSPVAATNSGTATGSIPLWSFTGTGASCQASGGPGAHLIASFNNDTIPAFQLTCSGNGLFTNSVLLGSLPSGAAVPLCGSSTQLVQQCSTGSAFPLATSAPLTITNSQPVGSTGLPSWAFSDTGNGCGDGAPNTNYIATWQNSAPSVIFAISCTLTAANGGGIYASAITTKTGIIDNSLNTPAPNPSPICGGFGVAETNCGAGGIPNALLAVPPITAVNGSGCINASTSSNVASLSFTCPSPPPVYTQAGAPVSATYHCLADTVTAAGASTTVTLTGAAVFSASPAMLSIIDRTDGTQVSSSVISAITASSFTFTSVSTKVYYFSECGV